MTTHAFTGSVLALTCALAGCSHLGSGGSAAAEGAGASASSGDPAGSGAQSGNAGGAGGATGAGGGGTSSLLSFTAIPSSDPELMGPGRGAENWQGVWLVDVPVEGASAEAFNFYDRFAWTQFEVAEGEYDFTRLDERLHAAIDKRQRYGFGVMTMCPQCEGGFNGLVTFGGGSSAYPPYLHALMQAESPSDWQTNGTGPTSSGGDWVPNWNSPAYLSRFEALLVAIEDHLQTGSHDGVAYKDAISYIDVRGFGSWGEWHNYAIVDQLDSYPPGTAPTATSLIDIIDAHITAFPDYPLVTLIAAYDGNRLQNIMNPPEVGYHALTAENGFGPLGWRRDNWGAPDGYIHMLLDQNDTVYSGLLFSDAIMDRYKVAPIVGEPCCSYDYVELETQVRQFHAMSFGNGNYLVDLTPEIEGIVRAASKAAGYRIELRGGGYTSLVGGDRVLEVSLEWINVGVAPPYDDWDVVFELADESGTVVWSATSAFELKLFAPEETPTKADDALVLPSASELPAGTYELAVVVRDAKGYTTPLPLAIAGRRDDGSHALGQVIVP